MKMQELVAVCAFVSAVATSVGVSATEGAQKASAKAGPLEAVDDGDRITVTVDGKPFAELRYKGEPKPIVYPIVGPHGITMVRHFPMRTGVSGEREDHPHHQSLWFTHGDVNGVNFWNISKETGKIVCTDARAMDAQYVSSGGNAQASVSVELADEWRDAGGNIVCTDQQEIGFVLLPDGGRAVDYAVTVIASHGDVTFGDTKEGTMGIRTHPKLRINDGAKAVNSEGVEGKTVWGKRAKWVDYSAEIDGHVVGVAIFDHPKNPRHPTWWHAREYGLVAANPFGIHDFERKDRGAGNLTIKKGEMLTFRYRFLFHEGDSKGAEIAKRYADWAH